MRPRRDIPRALGALTLLLSSATLAAACSSTKEWEEKPGTLALYASPLPPVAGQELFLGVEGENIGPVDVYQGTVRIASFVNPDLRRTSRVDVRVTAHSSETPRAISVAYDRKLVEVAATGFPSTPQPVDPVDAGIDSGGEPLPPPPDDCPGVEDLTMNECGPEPPGRGVSVRLTNGGPNPVSVYELRAPIVDGQPCQLALLALVRSGNAAQVSSSSGAILRIVDDRTAQAIRIVRVPDTSTCALSVPRP